MASPFPGMDPFLENPELFPGLHDHVVVQISEVLQARLPETYYAEIGSRLWVEFSRRPIKPDVDVLRSNGPAAAMDTGTGGVAVAVGAEPVAVFVPHDESHENFVEIYTQQGGRRLVTSLEILSLSNKTPGEHGRDLYLQKQRELLRTLSNLVEIDLLRGGVHRTAVPRDQALTRTGPFDYHVCIHRFDDLQRFFVHPIRLEQRLPEIAIPLLPGDPPVPLDLQAVFDHCYDTGPYRRLNLYREGAVVPPLGPEHAEWAGRLLREKGLLS